MNSHVDYLLEVLHARGFSRSIPHSHHDGWVRQLTLLDHLASDLAEGIQTQVDVYIFVVLDQLPLLLIGILQDDLNDVLRVVVL
jgi:hypothetical protein